MIRLKVVLLTALALAALASEARAAGVAASAASVASPVSAALTESVAWVEASVENDRKFQCYGFHVEKTRGGENIVIGRIQFWEGEPKI